MRCPCSRCEVRGARCEREMIAPRNRATPDRPNHIDIAGASHLPWQPTSAKGVLQHASARQQSSRHRRGRLCRRVLVEELLKRGYAVKVFDRLIYGDHGLRDVRDRVELVVGDMRAMDASVLRGRGGGRQPGRHLQRSDRRVQPRRQLRDEHHRHRGLGQAGQGRPASSATSSPRRARSTIRASRMPRPI